MKCPAYVIHAERQARRKRDDDLAARGAPVELREETPEAAARRKANQRALRAAGIKTGAVAPRLGRR